MSLALNPIPTAVVFDPNVDFSEPRIYTILKGAAQNTWKNVISSSYSNSSFTVSAPPPNPSCVVDRKIYMKMRVSIDITGTAPPGQLLLQSGYFALRSFPLSRLVNTMNISINNTSCNINMADVLGSFLCYNNNVFSKEYEYSMTPSTLDQSTDYQSLVNTVRNPLAGYIDSNDSASTGRGAFGPAVFTNTNTTAHLEYDLCEPLFLSPLMWGRNMHKGFVGVQTFDVTVNWVSNLERILSLATGSGSTYTNISVNLGQPSLLFHYSTMQLLESIPRSVEYAYNVVDRYPTFVGSIGPGVTTTVSSSNIQMKGIPKKGLVFARKQNSDLTAFDTDSFLPIKSMTLNFNNNAGIFSGMSQFDIYNMCKKNGLCQSWTQFSGAPIYNSVGGSLNRLGSCVGGPVVFEFGSDVGLSSVEAPGLDGTYQFQIDVTLTNQNPYAAVNAMLYIVIITEGTWTIENNRSVSQTGVISKLDILNSEKSPVIKYKQLEHMMGGNIFEDIASGFAKALGWVRDNVLPVARDVVPLVSALSGKGEGAIVGGEYVGGASMPRHHLRRRLQ